MPATIGANQRLKVLVVGATGGSETEELTIAPVVDGAWVLTCTQARLER